MNQVLLISASHHLPPFSIQPLAALILNLILILILISPISDILYPILPLAISPPTE